MYVYIVYSHIIIISIIIIILYENIVTYIYTDTVTVYDGNYFFTHTRQIDINEKLVRFRVFVTAQNTRHTYAEHRSNTHAHDTRHLHFLHVCVAFVSKSLLCGRVRVCITRRAGTYNTPSSSSGAHVTWRII